MVCGHLVVHQDSLDTLLESHLPSVLFCPVNIGICGYSSHGAVFVLSFFEFPEISTGPSLQLIEFTLIVAQSSGV